MLTKTGCVFWWATEKLSNWASEQLSSWASEHVSLCVFGTWRQSGVQAAQEPQEAQEPWTPGHCKGFGSNLESGQILWYSWWLSQHNDMEVTKYIRGIVCILKILVEKWTWMLQDFFWMGGPSQPGPPFTGAGESQVRCRTWVVRWDIAVKVGEVVRSDETLLWLSDETLWRLEKLSDETLCEGWKLKKERKLFAPEVPDRSRHYRKSTLPSPPNCQELQILMMIGIQVIQQDPM